MLFKGTERRGVGQIASLVEGAGGDINAYTTFDKTVFYLTLPTAEAKLGFDVLSDALFHSSFDEEEFFREREVILEEIKRGNDDPGAQMGRKIFATLYEGTEAGRPVIGFSEQVGNFSRETLVNFWTRWYQPENINVVVVGNIAETVALDHMEAFFGKKSPRGSTAEAWGAGRHRSIKRSALKGVKAVVITGDFEQTRLDIAVGAPSTDSPDCPLIDVASYVLGGSEVSRLQRRLKEKEGVVNAIGASAYTPIFEGIFEVSAALEPSNYAAATFSIARELALLVGREPPTQQEVDRARAASRIGKIHREETVDGVARAIVSGLSTPMKDKFEDIYDRLLHDFQIDELPHAMHRDWDFDSALIVALCDKAHAPTEEELIRQFKSGITAGSISSSEKIGLSHSAPGISIHRFDVGHGVPVIYRHIEGAKMFSVAAATEGGLRGETVATTGMFHAMATLMGLATKTRPFDVFSGRLEDLGAVLGGFSGKDSIGFEMHCTEEQVEEMIACLGESLLEPVFPEEQWEVYRRETLESLKLQQDSPSWICMRRLHQAVFGKHPYALPVTGIERSVREFTAEKLQTAFQSWRDQGRWVIAVAGGVPVDHVQRCLTKSLKGFNPKPERRGLPAVLTEDMAALGVPLKPRRTQEQAHLAIAGRGPKWGDLDRAAIDILINILGGHGGRLFASLREKESLAYSVSPLHSQGVLGGLIGAYIATSQDKTAQAFEGLDRELGKIAVQGPTADEVVRAKAYILGSHEIGLQRTSSQTMTMALMELYGVGWDDFVKYPSAVSVVDPSTIRQAAAKYFDPSSMHKVLVG
jgi:zinc protease